MSIEEFVEKYKDFFMATELDVAKSIKGKWYLSAYNEEYSYYDCFVEFETVEELVDLVTREWAFLVNCAIDYETDVPVFEKSIVDQLESYTKPSIEYEELLYNLKAIVNSELGNIEMFKYLDSFIKLKQKLGNSASKTFHDENDEACIRVGEENDAKGSVVYYYLPDIDVLGLMIGTVSYIYRNDDMWEPDFNNWILDRIHGCMDYGADEKLFRADLVSKEEAKKIMTELKNR